MVADSSSFVNVVCSFLLLESATVDGFRICVWPWEAGSSLILLIYEARKKVVSLVCTGVERVPKIMYHGLVPLTKIDSLYRRAWGEK